MADKDTKKMKMVNNSAPTGFVLFVAFIGAVVYFVDKADGFWEVILALLKAIVWPAFVTYHVLQVLGV